MPGRPVCMTIKPPPTEQPQKSSKKVKSSKKEAMKQEDGHAEHSPGELEDDLENMLDVEVNKEEQNGTRKPREKTLSGDFMRALLSK